MTFEQFIKNHVRVAPGDKRIEITPAQRAFINWIEDCKKKGLKPFYLKGKGRI